MKILSPMVLTSVFLLLLGAARLGAAADPEGKLLSQWNLSNFDGKQVPNLVEDGGPLIVGNTSPTAVTEGELKGLHFEAGQSLQVQSHLLPGMGGFGEEHQPFSLEVVLSPSSLPSGYWGGIFEAMVFEQSGFRMSLDQHRKIAVEVFCSDGTRNLLVSRSVLELGRAYKVEIRFESHSATLLIDGRTDAEKEMPLPAPYQGNVAIGTTGGTDYFFNGTISEITLRALTPTP
jgi:hypothetical protein